MFFLNRSSSQQFTVWYEITLPLPLQSESSLLDRCPGVGKFICKNCFDGRVELREVFRACGDKDHPDWEEYDEAMVKQDAVIVLVKPDRVYGKMS